MKKNILITSAGRRVELVKLFKKAKKELGVEGEVVAVDISKSAPAIYYADDYRMVSRIDSGNYIEDIIKVAKEKEIDLIVPTIDTELLILSENKDKILKKSGAKVLISGIEAIKICRDKVNTQKFFEENGFGVPNLVCEDRLEKKQYEFPLFIKPLNGSSSINTFKVNNEKELEFFLKYVPNPMVQGFIEGDEFTVDTFLDFDSNIISIAPRKRLATRSGEISKGEIVKDREVIEEVRKVLDVLKPIGHITVQCMKTKDGIKFIEINPRFGGGAPMSIMAGANSPKNLYRLLNDEKLEYSEDYKDNFRSYRFDEAIFIDNQGKVVKNV